MSGQVSTHKDDPLRGVAWMLLTMVSIAAQDALGKYLSQFYPVPFVVWARFLGHFLVVAIILAPRFPKLIHTARPGLQALRSVLLFSLSLSYILGMTYMPLAESTAIMFMSPMLVTLLSVPLMGEKIGMRRVGAIVVGFIGAMIIIRPGFGAVQWAGLLPLTAAFCLALYQIANRIVSRHDAALTSLFLSSIGGVILSSLLVPAYWRIPAIEHVPLLVLIGAVGAATHFAMLRAFALAPASVVAPYTYTRLIWATILGLLVFGNLPDQWTIAGAAIIVVSSAYVFVRDRQAKNAAE